MYRERIFKELRFEFLKTVVLESVLDTAIAFLLSTLLISLVKIPFFRVELFTVAGLGFTPKLVAASTISVFFFVYVFAKRKTRFSLAIYGRRDVSLVEMLKTAQDNLYRENDVVQELFANLADRLRRVSAGHAFSLRSLSLRFLSVITLSFLVVFSGALVYELPQLNVDVPGLLRGGGSGSGQRDVQDVSLDENASIYGEEADVEFGDRQLNLSLTQFEEGGEEDAALQEQEFNRGTYPGEVRVIGAGAAPEEQIEDFELAKQYSLAIRG